MTDENASKDEHSVECTAETAKARLQTPSPSSGGISEAGKNKINDNVSDDKHDSTGLEKPSDNNDPDDKSDSSDLETSSPFKNPWNAVSVIGFRVDSKDLATKIELVSPESAQILEAA
jgi:hypothetical protein